MKILTYEVRRKKHLTLMQLQELTGLSKSTLNNIENELVSPTLKELELIAKATEFTISDLYESDYK